MANKLVEILNFIRPGEQWKLTGNTLTGLEWLDITNPPDQAEVDQGDADLTAYIASLETPEGKYNTDLSNESNRLLKAFCLVYAEREGLTPSELKTLIKTKM